MPTLHAAWLGMVPYQQAWDLQNRLAAEIAEGQRPPTLLLLEHPHTFTFGRRGQAENLLWDEAELIRRGVTVHWVDRGGDITYHGPGQLVGYPLIPLSPIRQPDPLLRSVSNQESEEAVAVSERSPRIPAADYTGYLRNLESVLIKFLAQLGVPAFGLPGLTGVWTTPPGAHQPAKIAAIGVKVDRFGITRHGFALNLMPDMTYFDGIIACGLAGHPVTSLSAHLSTPPIAATLAHPVAQIFCSQFGFDRLEFNTNPDLTFLSD